MNGQVCIESREAVRWDSKKKTPLQPQPRCEAATDVLYDKNRLKIVCCREVLLKKKFESIDPPQKKPKQAAAAKNDIKIMTKKN